MASAPKTLASAKKRHVRGQNRSEPETADEYLEGGSIIAAYDAFRRHTTCHALSLTLLKAAVELEEAGEKWRAGDPQKALRFFTKAVELYDAGLRTHSESFDLAYNKARLQYEISQQSRLVSLLPQGLLDVLHVALQSHVVATRNAGGNNADVIFNLAQVYTSLAEAKSDQWTGNEEQRQDIGNDLYQALGLFDKCLRIQEQEMLEAQQQQRELAQASPSYVMPETFPKDESTAKETEMIWASVAEPVTEDNLLDTCLAKLDVLKVLCNVQATSDEKDLQHIEKIFSSELEKKLHGLGQGLDRTREVVLGRTTFLVAFAIARFRYHMNLQTLEHEFHQALSDIQSKSSIEADAEALCSTADAHIDLNTAIEEDIPRMTMNVETTSAMNRIRWQHITKALEHYGLASRITGAQNLYEIHMSKGDCELLRARLGDQPLGYDLAIQSRGTLLKNAKLYYNAGKRTLANRIGFSETEKDLLEAEIKMGVVASMLSDHSDGLKTLLQQHPSGLRVLRNMRDHGLLGEAPLSTIEQMIQTQL